MKTWDDWSDSEITIAVNGVTKKYHDVGIGKADGDDGWIGGCVGKDVVIGWEGEGIDEELFIIDYCNNWSDIGPICLDSGISIINDNGYCYATTNPLETYESVGLDASDNFYQSKASDKNKLLRAAAIVFLEMNGVKP